jgi:hypothetical protein
MGLFPIFLCASLHHACMGNHNTINTDGNEMGKLQSVFSVVAAVAIAIDFVLLQTL